MFNSNDLFWGFILAVLVLLFSWNKQRKRAERIAERTKEIKKHKDAEEKEKKKILKKIKPLLNKYQKIVMNLPDGKSADNIQIEFFRISEKIKSDIDDDDLYSYEIEYSFEGNTMPDIDHLVEAFHKGEATKKEVVALLKKLGKKVPASDVDGHLDYRNVDRIKELCEELYFDGKIQRTGNYRYFILKK